MANGNDPLAFIRELMSGGGQIAPNPLVGVQNPMMGLVPPTQQEQPLEAPVFPDTESIQAPANKKALLLAALGRILRSGGNARGRLPQQRGPDALQQLVNRRGLETQRLRNDALRKFGAEQRTFERDTARRDVVADRAEDREFSVEDRDARINAMFSRGEMDAASRKEISDAANAARIKAAEITAGTRPNPAAEAKSEMMNRIRFAAYESRKTFAEQLKTSTAKDIRDEYLMSIDAMGLDEGAKAQLINYWMQWIDPALVAAEQAPKHELGPGLTGAFEDVGRTPPTGDSMRETIQEQRGLGPIRDLLSFGNRPATAPTGDVRSEAMFNQWLKRLNQGQ